MLEARILFDLGSPPGGTETLTFTGLPPGATTVPSVVSYVVSPTQTFAAVTFQIAVGAGTLPGPYPIMVENAPTAAGSADLLLIVPGISVSPGDGGRGCRCDLQPPLGVDQPVRPTGVHGYADAPLLRAPGGRHDGSVARHLPGLLAARRRAWRAGPSPAVPDGGVPDRCRSLDASRKLPDLGAELPRSGRHLHVHAQRRATAELLGGSRRRRDRRSVPAARPRATPSPSRP